jgi:hypothetical protein
MAPTYTARAEKEKSLNVLLSKCFAQKRHAAFYTNDATPAFANTLHLHLQSPRSVLDTDLLGELQKHVDSFPGNTSPAVIARNFDKLESRGAALWNLATRLKRGVEGDRGGVMACWGMLDSLKGPL